MSFLERRLPEIGLSTISRFSANLVARLLRQVIGRGGWHRLTWTEIRFSEVGVEALADFL